MVRLPPVVAAAALLLLLLCPHVHAFLPTPMVGRSTLPLTAPRDSQRTNSFLLLKLLKEDKKETSSSSSSSISSTGNNKSNNDTADAALVNSTTDNTTVVLGIGGENGLVYDVNRLKRNLVQETLKEYKSELWSLLGSPRSSEDEIETKLAALVQANPVSTTTDSNLLDKQKWCLAFGSSQPATDLLDSNRFEWRNLQESKQKQQKAYGGQNPFCTKFRTFQLETDVEEDPYMMDHVRVLGGLISKKRLYKVLGFTRTEMELDLSEREVSVFGKRLWSRSYLPETRSSIKIQIIYLDPDFMVSSSNGPFAVYTKNQAWMDPSSRIQRNVRFGLFGLVQLQEKLVGIFKSSKNRKQDTLVDDAIFSERELSGDSKVTVLKLGELGSEEEVAWDSEADPFIHLSAVERQEHLKKLSVKQIDKAKRSKERRYKKRRNLFSIQSFKKPQDKHKKKQS